MKPPYQKQASPKKEPAGIELEDSSERCEPVGYYNFVEAGLLKKRVK